MASWDWLFQPSLKRSASLPSIFPAHSFEDEEDTDSEEEDDYTEETDGSDTPGVSPYFRNTIPSFGSPSPSVEKRPLTSESDTTGEAPDYDDSEDAPKPKPKRLVLEPSSTGTFSFIANSPPLSHTSDPAPPTSKEPAHKSSSTKSIPNTSSCLDFRQLTKKIESKQRNQSQPWNNIRPNLHPVKQPKKLVDLLSHLHADPNAKNTNGDAPIHTYIMEGRKHRGELLIAILSCGRMADVNIKNEEGHTPLHIATMKNDLLSACVLIAFGADLKVVDGFRLTPYDKLINQEGPLRTLMESLLADPGFINRTRIPTITSPVAHCTRDMIGYRLACRREPRFAMEIEDQIKNMLYQQEIGDPCEAGAAFMQWNHILRWRKTKGRHARPGSRVLFLDGGGVRGLMIIETLMEIEKRTGETIMDLFDWIVGTSTGGIVALGLVYAGLTLVQLKELFFQFSQHVFKDGMLGWPQAISNSLAMNEILQSVFKHKMMLDVTEPKVLISSVDITDSSLSVEFFNNYEPSSSHLSNLPVWKVARMTSAAPIYFTDFQKHVDGGLKANNPCDLGMNKIREYYNNMNMALPHFSIMVSIGTGIFPSQRLDDLSTSIKNVFNTVLTIKDMSKLLQYAINRSEENAKNFQTWCHSMTPEIPFFRFNPPFTNEIKPNETDKLLLVDMLIKTKQYLVSQDVLNDLYLINKMFQELTDFQN